MEENNPKPRIKRDPSELALKLISWVHQHLGEVSNEREQLFLIEITEYVDTIRWIDEDYHAFTQLFDDYRQCLVILGPAACEIGLKVSYCAKLFEDPRRAIQLSYLVSFLIDLARLRPRPARGE